MGTEGLNRKLAAILSADVAEEEGRIYGDGVNIGARVEGLTDGGGICISGTAYDQVVNKLGLEYEFLGEQEVKNIERPIRVYRVLSFPGAAAHRVVQAKTEMGKKWRIDFKKDGKAIYPTAEGSEEMKVWV